MGSVNDPNNDHERLQKRLEEIQKLPQDEYEVINFWQDTFGDKHQPSTLERHLGHLLTIREKMVEERAESIKKRNETLSDAEATDQAREQVSLLEATKFEWSAAVTALETERGWTSGTKRNYQKSIRVFLDGCEDETTADPSSISLAEDDSGGDIGPEDILSHEQIRILIEEASNRNRDKAMFSLLIDCGLRIAALCSLRIKDYDPQPKHGIAELELNKEALGLKGSEGRTQVTTFSTAYIDRYLNDDHPRPDDDEAPLFHKSKGRWDEDDPDDDGSISPMIFRRRMKRLADGFDIEEEKLHPHNLKHAAVTMWALRGMSDREIEYRAGWARESGQLDRYEHLDDDEINDVILEKHDIDIDREEENNVLPIENCPRCGYTVDPGFTYCGNCGQMLEQTTYPEWFEKYREKYGEDQLVQSLKDSPSRIPQTSHGLDADTFQRYRGRLEEAAGENLSVPPVPDKLQFQLPDGEGEERLVSIPRSELGDRGIDGPSKVRETADGVLEVLDDDGNVIFRNR